MAYMDDATRVHAWEMSPPKRNPDDMSFDDLQEEELDEEEEMTQEGEEPEDESAATLPPDGVRPA